jgi:hypothetical protein
MVLTIHLVLRMSDKESLRRVKALLESVASRSSPFISQCSETKLLAYSNRGEAYNRYKHLAKEALIGSKEILSSEPGCQEDFKTVESAIDRDKLTPDLVGALNSLRDSYLNRILRPALKGYLTSKAGASRDLEALYERAFTLNELIEVAEFFDKFDLF